ncbi:hypothetical protein I4U23_004452 [Adineta vaga]|nr:hypothetical protein I4U23_004452 [Adineta vaga]
MLMSIFGILTIVNVRSIRGQTDVNVNSARIQRLRSHDRQLSIMLLFQVIITIVISIPYFALAIYNAIAIVMFQYNFSSSEMAIYNFAYNLFRLLYFTNPVLTFYIYTMTGPKFRNEMKRCVRYGLKTIIGILGLRRCLPLRAQQILFGENQNIQTNNVLLSRTKKRDNIIVPI